ncbi:xanthine dehydrogenase family protein molybdopterin-binding subunit [Streptomyces sp. 4F14]|uniref:xanthine dehydrogenase family protein molybdopterin-binding subunit n=1 Tax=Streptomyces sp. 4F14 TaxID=3394380 RepID=UPI003A89B71C
MNAGPESAVGSVLSRAEGRLKVTGRATFTADHTVEGAVHAVVVGSRIARGRITGIDTRAADGLPGVLGILSHLDVPRPDLFAGEEPPVLQDDRVRYFGQPVAVVVARTPEAARHAAGSVQVTCRAERPETDLSAPGVRENDPRPWQDHVRGTPDEALAEAEVTVEGTFRIARVHPDTLEPHTTVARWDDDRLTVWDRAPWTPGAQDELASVFGIPPQDVCIVPPSIGTSGSAPPLGPYPVLAALAARAFGRPVKLVPTREQQHHAAGYRPAHTYTLCLGATRGGRLSAADHRIRAETSGDGQHIENALTPGRALYFTPHLRQTHRTVPLDVSPPTYLWGPGSCAGTFAVESAMDELAHELGIDPLELRLRNLPEDGPLRACLRTGAREFGWDRRAPAPRSRRDGDLLIGTGVAGGVHDTLRTRARAHVRLDADGTALVRFSTTDPGPARHVSLTRLAADTLGLTPETVRLEPDAPADAPAPPHAGSQTMNAARSAVQDACDRLRRQAVELAVTDEHSPLYGADPADIRVRAGRLHLTYDRARGETYRQLLTRNARPHLETRGAFTPDDPYAFSAVFTEVAVDRRLGSVRVRRMLGVYAAGRTALPALAARQALGGLVSGIGQALLGQTVTDHRDGRIVHADLTGHPVPADVPDLRAIPLDGQSRRADPVALRSVGEIVRTGVAPAIANAVFHATGRRLRDLPISTEALL